MIIKIIGPEVTLSANSNVSRARAVRIYNENSSDVVIHRNNSEGTLIGNTTVQANTVIVMDKDYDDELGSSANVLVTPIGYSLS